MPPTPTLIRDTLVDPAPGTLITPSFPFLDASHLHFWDEDDTEITEKFDPTTPGSFFPKEAITGTVILSRYTPREEVYRVFSDGSSISSARFNEVFTWVLYILQEGSPEGDTGLAGLTPEVLARLLPTLPATGSRDGKVVEFKGDTLEWVEAESSSIRLTDEEIGRLAFQNAPDPASLTQQQRHDVSRATDIGVRWRGEWTSGFAYEVGDLITHQLSGGITRGFYYALSGNTASAGNQPGTSSTGTWYLLALSNGALDSVTGVTRSGSNLVFSTRGGGTTSVSVPMTEITQATIYAVVKDIMEAGTGIQIRQLDAPANRLLFNVLNHRYVPTVDELFERFVSIIQAGENTTVDIDRTDHTLTLNSEGTAAEGMPMPQVLTVGTLGTFIVNSGASREIPITAVSASETGYATKTAGSNNTVTISKASTVRAFATVTVRRNGSNNANGRILPVLTPSGSNVSLLTQSSPYVRTAPNNTNTYTVSLSATFVVAADDTAVTFSIGNREIYQDYNMAVTAITRMGILPLLGPRGTKGDKGDPGSGAEFVNMSQTLEGYTFNTSFGITEGQFHVGTDDQGRLRLSVSIKDGETLGDELAQPGTIVNFRDFGWQVMQELLPRAGRVITFLVRDLTLGQDTTPLANVSDNLGFLYGINPRALTLEGRVDVVEKQHFVPSQANLFDAVSAIVQKGTGITITRNSSTGILTVSADAMAPTKENTYPIVKSILTAGANANLAANDTARTITVNAEENAIKGLGFASWLFSDGTHDQIDRFNATTIKQLLGDIPSNNTRRTDVRLMLTGYIPGFNSLDQLVSVSMNGQSARERTNGVNAALEKGEFIGNDVSQAGASEGHFTLFTALTNTEWSNLVNNGPSNGRTQFRLTYNLGSGNADWFLNIPFLLTAEEEANPPVPHVPIESVKNGIDIDQVKQTYGTASVVGNNHEIPTRLQLNAANTKAAVGKLVIPLAENTVADNAVTTAKLADNAVTAAKLADNAVITARLANAAVTPAKLAPATVTGLSTIKVPRLPTTSINENATYFQMGNGVAGTAAPGLYVRHSGAWTVVSRRKVRIGTFTRVVSLSTTYASTGITLPLLDDDDCVVFNIKTDGINNPLDYCIPWYRLSGLTRTTEGVTASTTTSYVIGDYLDGEPDIQIALTTANLVLLAADSARGSGNISLVVSRT